MEHSRLKTGHLLQFLCDTVYTIEQYIHYSMCYGKVDCVNMGGKDCRILIILYR